jgi:hypothetical protein
MEGKRALGFSPTVLGKKFRAGMTVRSYRDKEVVFRKGMWRMLSSTSRGAR